MSVIFCGFVLTAHAQNLSPQDNPLHLSSSLAILGNYNHGTTNNYTTTATENFMLMNSDIQYSLFGNFKYREDSYIIKSRELAGLFDVDFYPVSEWSPYFLSNAEESYERAIAFRIQAGLGLKWAFWKDTVGNSMSFSVAGMYDQTNYSSPKGGDNFSTRRYSLRLKGSHKIFSSGMRFQYMYFFQPNIIRVHDYRMKLVASIDIPATPAFGFRVAVTNTYENEPAAGKLSNSFALDYGLTWNVR